MNFFEQELRTFTGKDTAFKSSKPVYAGRACFLVLSEGHRARIEFVTGMFADHYDALLVTILNRNDGKVDQLRVRFEDYCQPRKGGCSGTVIPHIWVYNSKPIWYSAPTSSEIKTVASAAYDYIQLFA